MAIQTSVTKLFGIEHPVLLAPMGSVAGGALAAAVSRAGGLGIIGGGYGDRAQLETEFAAAGNTPVGVGFITWSLEKQPELLDLALARAPKALFLSFGELGPFAPKIKRAGVPLIAQVQTLEQAKRALGEGADVLVAQGTEAGGHGAARATLPLVPAVVDIAGNSPVLAAGGIGDGRGLAAALMLGAAGVVCGTVFYAARSPRRIRMRRRRRSWPPATIPSAGRRWMWSGASTGRRNGTFAPCAIPSPSAGRAIRTGSRPISRRSGRASWPPGRPETRTIAAVIVGEAVDLVREVRPAGDIVRNIVADAEKQIRQASDLLSANS